MNEHNILRRQHRSNTNSTMNTKTEEDEVEVETTVEIIEEDWSGVMNSSANRDDDDGPSDGSNFSYYDTVVFPLGGVASMKLRCMKRLTPLDMLDLSNGVRDSTGNRVWMGAIFFLECFVRPIGKTKHTRQRDALRRLRGALFHDKTVLELGAGTGASLIAVGMAGTANQPENETETDRVVPRKLTLTDNDTTVLSLCRMNCASNFDTDDDTDGDGDDKYRKNPYYTVGRLDWGEFCKPKELPQEDTVGDTLDPFFLESSSLVSSYDCVVATDVIYHLSTIEILFRTASRVLKHGGTFVLAHVPRADMDCQPSRIRESLESEILTAASNHGFSTSIDTAENANNLEDSLWSALKILCTENNGNGNYTHGANENCIIRPSSIMGVWVDEHENNKDKPRACNTKSFFSPEYNYDDLDSTGSSILIFVKD